MTASRESLCRGCFGVVMSVAVAEHTGVGLFIMQHLYILFVLKRQLATLMCEGQTLFAQAMLCPPEAIDVLRIIAGDSQNVPGCSDNVGSFSRRR